MKKLLTALFALGLFASLSLRAEDQSESLAAGSKFALIVQHNADATQPLTYKWFKDGVEVGQAATFEIASVTTADSGTYTVTVTNEFGTATNGNYVLKVGVPPSGIIIKRVLTNQVVRKQSRLEWGIEAEGDGLTFRWQKGNSLLTGATGPTLIIPKVNPSHEGMYKVTVRNKNGEEVSSMASLTVL
jgi:hypothetical protein